MQNQIGFKAVVAKISGFAKFDVDTKISKYQFFHLLEQLCLDLETEDDAKSRAVTL